MTKPNAFTPGRGQSKKTTRLNRWPEGEVVETGLTVEDAMKIVFSGGIVLPDTLAVEPTVALTDLPDGTDGPITFPAPPTNADEPQPPDANDD